MALMVKAVLTQSVTTITVSFTAGTKRINSLPIVHDMKNTTPKITTAAAAVRTCFLTLEASDVLLCQFSNRADMPIAITIESEPKVGILQ
jgi:hypothetical protein